MKKIDSTNFADLVGAVVKQCRDDIVDFWLEKGSREDAEDAADFITGNGLKYYLHFFNFLTEDIADYQKKFFESCEKKAEGKYYEISS